MLAARLARWGKDRERYGIIHSDLMPDNLLLTADGVRLIDFDDAGFGWYLYDAASALLIYHGSDLFEALLASWREGYGGVRALTDADLAELPTFLLLRCFYALGWLHVRRNSPWAEAFIAPVVQATMALGSELLGA
jgi:Ser/Thr protein kinase RdoA (MazF antagonist)